MLCDSRAWTSNERVDLRPSSRLSDSLLEDSGDERTRYEETLIWTRSVEVPLVTLSLYNTSAFWWNQNTPGGLTCLERLDTKPPEQRCSGLGEFPDHLVERKDVYLFRVLLPMFKKVIPTVWMESEPHLQMDSAEKRTFLQPKVEKKDLI